MRSSLGATQLKKQLTQLNQAESREEKNKQQSAKVLPNQIKQLLRPPAAMRDFASRVKLMRLPSSKKGRASLAVARNESTSFEGGNSWGGRSSRGN
jgi:hypothetical protein